MEDLVAVAGKGQGFKTVRSTKRNFELVIRQLRGMIEAGRLEPGERLPTEPKLAEEFGVSRTALREALKVLELSGYLEIKRGYGGGTFVRRPTAEEFREIPASTLSLPNVTALQLFQVCLAIEPLAAGVSAGADLREVEPLEDMTREMEVFDDRPARVLEANFGFHLGVARASGNPVFVAMMGEMRPAIFRHLNLRVRDPEWRAARREEHARVSVEIKAGNREKAEAAMRRHVENELGMK